MIRALSRSVAATLFVLLTAAAYYTSSFQPATTTSAACTPWEDAVIGSAAGSAVYDPCSSDTITITSDGYVPANTQADSQHVVYQSICGDGEVIARVQSVTPPLIRLCRGVHSGEPGSRSPESGAFDAA